MATYYARLAGNINASNVWATTPSGTAAAVTFASGDVLVANSFAIAINVDTNLGGAGQVRNDTLGGATAGGGFTLSNGVTLTANVYSGTASGIPCVTFVGASGSSAFLVGNIVAGSSSTIAGSAVTNTSTGTLNITGNATGGTTSAHGISTATAGIINITGNLTGGVSASGAYNNGTGTFNITGNVIGAGGNGVVNGSTGTVNIIGQATGSATGGTGVGASNISTGTIAVTRAIGNGYGPGSAGLAAVVGAANSALGVIQVEEIEFGALGMSPTSGAGIRLKKITNNVAKFNYCDTAGSKTLVDATQGQMPAATDVRNGVSYASGAATGSCEVPAASSVAFGVPVDATTGTATLTAANVRAALGLASANMDTQLSVLSNLDTTVSSRLAPSGTLATVTTLTNAPTVPTASAIATQVRTEMDSNSTQLTAIKAKTDLLETTRLAQCSTVATTGAQIAAALS